VKGLLQVIQPAVPGKLDESIIRVNPISQSVDKSTTTTSSSMI